ncbi:ATP-binding protein [Rhodovibrio salinarum]|uniref:Adenylate kinase n=1 Tax=Rhodovibrio salinarum TaxID=1087 RepID=A0A934QGB5_9PROT|nr:adenylate kinase [Rhodovibrio salinarum]MBK1696122.1 adenylate kinase [Rhodovibrio salinarum]
MTGRKIHITGGSCAGVSTLGAALAEQLTVPQIDVDDFYWMPTDPPFRIKRPIEDRISLIGRRQDETAGWILTGSCMSWGDTLIRAVDLIVFIYTPTATRLQRLDQRETARYGARILPGGDMHEAHLAFRDWASRYENPTVPGRNLAKHESWLRKQSAPILRLDGLTPTPQLVQSVQAKLSCLCG